MYEPPDWGLRSQRFFSTESEERMIELIVVLEHLQGTVFAQARVQAHTEADDEGAELVVLFFGTANDSISFFSLVTTGSEACVGALDVIDGLCLSESYCVANHFEQTKGGSTRGVPWSCTSYILCCLETAETHGDVLRTTCCSS